MNILIRLPNWLGDMVMSTSFVQAVKDRFPGSAVDLIAKKGIDFLLDHFPAHGQRYVFSKDEYGGLNGARKFGKLIRKQKRYDLFFCLPDSFSSAVMSLATGAKERVGYKKELRSVFLTHSFAKKKDLHRVEEYIDLLSRFQRLELPVPPVKLLAADLTKEQRIIININSEATSRRLPKEKAVSIITRIRRETKQEIILIGSNKEATFVDEVFAALPDRTAIQNLAGKTSLAALSGIIGSSRLMLTTDSGPAHVANALGVYTIVLFGAGNEKNTAPYNVNNRQVIRLGQLPCEPCVSNTCRLYGIPKCLDDLDVNTITEMVKKAITDL